MSANFCSAARWSLAVSGLSLAGRFFAAAGCDLPGAILGRVAWGAALVLVQSNRLVMKASRNELKGRTRFRETFVNNCDRYFIQQDYPKNLANLNPGWRLVC